MTSTPDSHLHPVTLAEIASQPQVWRRALALTGRMTQLLGRPGAAKLTSNGVLAEGEGDRMLADFIAHLESLHIQLLCDLH